MREKSCARYHPSTRRVWPWPAVLVEQVADWIGRLPGTKWLDAACGNGQLGTVLNGRKALVGLDVSAEQLVRVPPGCYGGTVRGSVTSMPVRNASLDGIASVETLEHVETVDRAIDEFSRCLRAGGHLIVTVPSVTLRSWWQMKRTGRPVYCDEREHVRELSSVPLAGFPHKFETWSTFEGRFRRRGFALLRTAGVGFLLPMWEGRAAAVEHAMNLLYRESANRWLGRLPIVRRFPYYRLHLFRKGEAA